MFLFNLLLVTKTTDWTQFPSEVTILPACEICNLIVQKLRTNATFDLIPEQGTECANSTSNNKYCHLIANITKDLKDNFGDKIPHSACGVIGPCVPSSIPDHTGEFCYPCRFIQALATGVKTGKKSTFVKRFCSTSRNIFANFCNKIEEETRTNNFYSLIDSPKSGTPAAVCSSYCKRKVKSGGRPHGPPGGQHPPNPMGRNPLRGRQNHRSKEDL